MTFLFEVVGDAALLAVALLALCFAERVLRFRRGQSNPLDHQAFRELSERGYNLDEPVSTLFAFFVVTHSSADHLVKVLGTDFQCQIEQGGINLSQPASGLNESREGWFVFARRTLILDGAVISALRRRFDALALQENGLFLGWKVASQWAPPGERISASAAR